MNYSAIFTQRGIIIVETPANATAAVNALTNAARQIADDAAYDSKLGYESSGTNSVHHCGTRNMSYRSLVSQVSSLLLCIAKENHQSQMRTCF